MKKLLFTMLFLMAGMTLMGQEKFYICDKYDSDSYNLSDLPELMFSSDQTQLEVMKDLYDIEDIDSIVFVKPVFPAVTITWTGNSATVDVPASIKGVTYVVNGGHVSITSKTTTDEILYVLQGESSNGSLTLNGVYKLTIHLNGVNLTSQKGAALDIQCGKRVELKMMKDTENTFVDCAKGAQKAALFCKGHLEIKGKGTLNVTGNTKHAICANEYLMIKRSTGTINVLSAVSDGIHCGAASKLTADAEDVRFIMKGGILNIANCGSDCIDSDDYGVIIMKGGEANLEVSQKDGVGMQADSTFYMTGGVINLNVTGSISHGIRVGYDANFDGGYINGTISGLGAKGIKCKKSTQTTATVKNGGFAHFRGTDVNFSVSGDIYTIDQSKCMGIRVDNDMHISGGNIHVTVQHANAIGVNVTSDLYQDDGTLHFTMENPSGTGLLIKAGCNDYKTGGVRVVD